MKELHHSQRNITKVFEKIFKSQKVTKNTQTTLLYIFGIALVFLAFWASQAIFILLLIIYLK